MLIYSVIAYYHHHLGKNYLENTYQQDHNTFTSYHSLTLLNWTLANLTSLILLLLVSFYLKALVLWLPE